MARRRKADGSRWLERSARAVTVWTGSSQAFAGAVGVIIVWALLGPVFHFSDTWQLVINTGTTIVTFLMVFLIQNTQNRDIQAVHIKLDELIRSHQGAHTALLNLEELSSEELENFRCDYLKLADEAREALRRGEMDTDTPGMPVRERRG